MPERLRQRYEPAPRARNACGGFALLIFELGGFQIFDVTELKNADSGFQDFFQKVMNFCAAHFPDVPTDRGAAGGARGSRAKSSGTKILPVSATSRSDQLDQHASGHTISVDPPFGNRVIPKSRNFLRSVTKLPRARLTGPTNASSSSRRGARPARELGQQCWCHSAVPIGVHFVLPCFTDCVIWSTPFGILTFRSFVVLYFCIIIFFFLRV